MSADLSRRGFLETLGLAGVSLTLPKPLKVMAARMADLEKPPLHVGYCKVSPAPEGGIFRMSGLGVDFLSVPSMERYNDYANRWVVSMFRREKNERGRGILYAQCPVCYVPESHIGMDPVGPAFAHCPIVLAPDDILEFWWTPEGDPRPRFPLPELRLCVRGTRSFGFKQGSRIVWHGFKDPMHYIGEYKVEHVCLERTRAIELGLVGPEEPELEL